jgi:hypothetical protein
MERRYLAQTLVLRCRSTSRACASWSHRWHSFPSRSAPPPLRMRGEWSHRAPLPTPTRARSPRWAGAQAGGGAPPLHGRYARSEPAPSSAPRRRERRAPPRSCPSASSTSRGGAAQGTRAGVRWARAEGCGGGVEMTDEPALRALHRHRRKPSRSSC